MGHILFQIHSSVWGIMILLFIISLIFYRQKIWSMILRLAYLVMIVTGVWMLTLHHFPALYDIKGVLAILLIGLMEMALGRRQKQKSVSLILVFAAIDLILILLIGYKIL
ncbi:DUF1516 family protein [Sporolactobacillus shoreae]|uniref:DUF1516 family protein n=1 Tax=Sporolactobacillus shoreae TaxID=1465501 RepID=A0A4Z0GPM3_9BACL|nr:DUF1516 family protein [Sporolactobacillus shoreae]TGA97986.1 DUF1516 family protein [Sporolactobacillus shoreae]